MVQTIAENAINNSARPSHLLRVKIKVKTKTKLVIKKKLISPLPSSKER